MVRLSSKILGWIQKMMMDVRYPCGTNVTRKTWENSGKQQLLKVLKHATTQKHKNAAKAKLNENQRKIICNLPAEPPPQSSSGASNKPKPASSSFFLLSENVEMFKTEIMWTIDLTTLEWGLCVDINYLLDEQVICILWWNVWLVTYSITCFLAE